MYKMELTREQELALIEIGLRVVMERVQTQTQTQTPEPPLVRKPRAKRKVVTGRKPGYRWSDAQRKRFSVTMKRKWAERRRQQEKGAA